MRNRRRQAVIAIVLGIAATASAGCTPSSACNVAGTCADCSFRGVCQADGLCACEDGWAGGDNYGCAGATCNGPGCTSMLQCTHAGGTWTSTTADSLRCDFCAPTAALLDRLVACLRVF
jgi:hypothetical protein